MGLTSLSSCCFCFSLETAGKILAWLTIIGSILSASTFSWLLVGYDFNEIELQLKQEIEESMTIEDEKELHRSIIKLKVYCAIYLLVCTVSGSAAARMLSGIQEVCFTYLIS